MQDFIVESEGRRFINIVKILPENLPSGKRILWKEINNDVIEISVDKHSAIGGNSKPFQIRRSIPICSELFELFGLWFGDGIKIQGGVKKLFGFANTEISLLKKFLSNSKNILRITSDRFNCIVSIPSEMERIKDEIKKKISEELDIPLENFWKTQINPTRNLVHVDVKISSRLLGFTISILLDRIKSIILQNKNFTSKFLSGLIASEANIHVRKCGRLGEILIAAKGEEKRSFIRKLLINLNIIPNKDKTIESQEAVLIHGFSNFRIVKEWNIASLHPLKCQSFDRGMNGFKEVQFRKGVGKLVVLKKLSIEPKTSSELAKHIQRTAFMARVYLRHLHKMGFIRKKKIIGRKIIWEISELGKKLLSSHKPIENLKKLQNL